MPCPSLDVAAAVTACAPQLPAVAEAGPAMDTEAWVQEFSALADEHFHTAAVPSYRIAAPPVLPASESHAASRAGPSAGAPASAAPSASDAAAAPSATPAAPPSGDWAEVPVRGVSGKKYRKKKSQKK